MELKTWLKSHRQIEELNWNLISLPSKKPSPSTTFTKGLQPNEKPKQQTKMKISIYIFYSLQYFSSESLSSSESSESALRLILNFLTSSTAAFLNNPTSTEPETI